MRGLTETRHVDTLLAGARQPRSDPARSETAIAAALATAPDDVDVRLAAYRFYFYAHRLADALPQAEAVLRHSARRLNIAADWRQVGPSDAAFREPDAVSGLYLQALIALGYCQIRLGDMAGAVALAKASSLDPSDRFGAGRLLAVLDRAEADEG